MRTIRWRALPYALLAIASLQVASAQAAGSGATDGVPCKILALHVMHTWTCWPVNGSVRWTKGMNITLFPFYNAAAALLALKGAATNAKFNTWTGEAPCGAKPWQYITCDKDRVVGL